MNAGDAVQTYRPGRTMHAWTGTVVCYSNRQILIDFGPITGQAWFDPADVQPAQEPS